MKEIKKDERSEVATWPFRSLEELPVPSYNVLREQHNECGQFWTKFGKGR